MRYLLLSLLFFVAPIHAATVTIDFDEVTDFFPGFTVESNGFVLEVAQWLWLSYSRRVEWVGLDWWFQVSA